MRFPQREKKDNREEEILFFSLSMSLRDPT